MLFIRMFMAVVVAFRMLVVAMAMRMPMAIVIMMVLMRVLVLLIVMMTTRLLFSFFLFQLILPLGVVKNFAHARHTTPCLKRVRSGQPAEGMGNDEMHT